MYVCTNRVYETLIHKSDNNSRDFIENSMALRHDLVRAILRRIVVSAAVNCKLC